VSEARARWRDQTVPALAVERLVFIDESGAKTNMARRYGRGPGGARVVAAAPAGHWSTTTMVCAVGIDGPRAPWVLDGALDADAFAVYCERVLAPALRPGDVVVLDNLGPHKDARARAAIEAAGARVLFLPPYSPDLNPIENMWSKVKALLRKAAARTFEALLAAIKDALAAVTSADCRGFFRHCGYDAPATPT
jgi:transposase